MFYRAPCARRLRSLEEVDKYLVMTDSLLTIDLFSFDVCLHTFTEYEPIKVKINGNLFASFCQTKI